MKPYRYRNTIQALKINDVLTYEHHARLIDESGDSILVSLDWVSKHAPDRGGYYVLQNGKDASYVSAADFEAAFTPVDVREELGRVSEAVKGRAPRDPKQTETNDFVETEAAHFRRMLGECEQKLCAAHIDIIESQAAHIETLKTLAAERLGSLEEYRGLLTSQIEKHLAAKKKDES